MDRRHVEAIYRTTPLQQGMLFHTLYAPASGVYVTQVSCSIRGIDVDKFRSAWQHVVDDTPILRTAFVWKRIEDAKQAVLRPGVVEVPLFIEDWRETAPEALALRRERFLCDDRQRGFELTKAPLM